MAADDPVWLPVTSLILFGRKNDCKSVFHSIINFEISCQAKNRLYASGNPLKIQAIIDQIKRHPAAGKIGMILCHNGVVRSTPRYGRSVTMLRITFDRDKLREDIAARRKPSGIAEILVEIDESRDDMIAARDESRQMVLFEESQPYKARF